MREPTFWILTSLATEARHGYGVIQEADRLSDGKVKLQAGTLYAALDRLTAEGLVEPDREETVDGRTRRYYRLTDDGASALDAEATRLQASAEAAAAQLRSPAPLHPGPGRPSRAGTRLPLSETAPVLRRVAPGRLPDAGFTFMWRPPSRWGPAGPPHAGP